ncbi:MAG: hypothetical protein CO080_11050, partial [Nitrospirae bacterium CG_4_9_14_0_8_um_filter_70_14]
MDNLFRDTEVSGVGERVEQLAGSGAVRIERIVSSGQSSPAGFWYDQAESEWVVLLRGAARIGFADGREVHLTPGDHLLLPPHTRHRLAWTDPHQPSVWLAI